MAGPPNKRIKTISVSRPIIYGNTAKKMGDVRPPNAPAEHTHIWTIFLRGPQNEDISYYIKQVVFKLHDTYPNSTRIISAPPFELTETGWGEFDINVKIHFVEEANEKVLSFYHRLRLHPYDMTQPSQEEIKSIFYDELVFNEPNEQFFQILMTKPGNLLPSNKTESCPFSKQLEIEEIDRINDGITEVEKQIEEYKDKVTNKIKEKSVDM
ncbi:NuA4 histone H4 acetyltransferase complex and the SWR1 complex subunit [Maudiozyma exigua]|uniref:Protein AF-9 homolog n=1 Tax=Maudiozyma exigua TaxID=34358 RepID=A0A9P6WDH0_MAUEX|nr:NuA4 histone H4 acetyltransferase complex and the SWR1 complex subunit [Kazachstania exigua]